MKQGVQGLGLALVALLAIVSLPTHGGEPLKVYILVGQSNMQGKARVHTIERLNMTEDSRQMYRDMVGEDGRPRAVKDAYGVYFTTSRGRPQEIAGPLVPGFGEEIDPRKTNFGPEFTFGIYMRKYLNEPFLIIKTAWGGKNILQQFRPPSAGELPLNEDKVAKAKAEGKLDAVLAEHKEKTGQYYRLMMSHVNKVLEDPGKYHPAYDRAAGHEIAGFVWFQGWNDLVGPYPYRDPKLGRQGGKDYSEYSRLLACFIRDVRKDLRAPAMPFVIGVLGVDGAMDGPFQNAMAAPAEMPEFKGTVAAVRTGQFWDMKLQELLDKLSEEIYRRVDEEFPDLKKKPRARQIQASKMRKAVTAEFLTAEEKAFLEKSMSNASFHYQGSAYIYGRIGKAFADAMAELHGIKAVD
jgi:alpha-galactosidase